MLKISMGLQGFGKWDGVYLDIYEGYLFRIGLIVEWYNAQDIVSWSNGSDSLSVLVSSSGPSGRYIQVNFTDFQARQFSLHATVVGEGATDLYVSRSFPLKRYRLAYFRTRTAIGWGWVS